MRIIARFAGPNGEIRILEERSTGMRTYYEGGVYQSYNSEKQGWESQGEIIDLSGKSSNCAWDLSASVCRN